MLDVKLRRPFVSFKDRQYKMKKGAQVHRRQSSRSTAKAQAQTTRHAVLVTYGGVSFHVAETGAPNGYAFRCSTGDDGAIWFFKRGMSRADWNNRA